VLPFNKAPSEFDFEKFSTSAKEKYFPLYFKEEEGNEVSYGQKS
jgi:hypothetical protein